MRPTIAREAEIARIAESEEARTGLRQHVEEIIEGPAFRGSARSGQFLGHILEEAIAGNFESLKERAIGVALFGRSPSYVTGEDAIVRVTANDVRKRLLQHYDRCGSTSKFHIQLPVGSYIPEIAYAPEPKANPLDLPAPALARSSNRSARRRFSAVTLLVVLNLALVGILLYGVEWIHSSRTQAVSVASVAMVSVLPWSVFFGSSNPTRLVTSDPDIYWIQTITHVPISVADYANHIYIPEHSDLTPAVKQICLGALRGDKAATTDARFAADAGALAESSSSKIDVQGARNYQFSDLKTDDNFIFLGSPRSNPWVSLFTDQLDFQFVLNKAGQENIRNVRPRPHEQALYVPNGGGSATRQSFAIIAFVQNPDQHGQVLLLAGISGEGTQAAGKLVTDLPRLSIQLRKCGITSPSPLRHFEMLLSVNDMAGSPIAANVLVCHILGVSAH